MTKAEEKAREVGALVENWMINPPKPRLFYMTPEQLVQFRNKVLEEAAAYVHSMSEHQKQFKGTLDLSRGIDCLKEH